MTDIYTAAIGVQWGWATDGTTVFSPTAYSATAGGYQRIEIPNPAGIRGYKWQSSVKVDCHEVLLHFLISPTGAGLGESGERSLLSVHHVANYECTSHVIPMMFDDDFVIPVDAGYVIWVFGIGSAFNKAGQDHPAPVEVQTTLYLSNI